MDTVGRTYLTSRSKSSRKSAVIMRVPDDILNLLDNCALNQDGSLPKLSIKFDGSTGVLKIQNDGIDENFSFNIAKNTTTRDSTYCVQENESRTLEVMALLQQKINVKPGASSFDRARSKMTDQRKKNPCAIEMVNSLTELGSKKVTKKRQRATATASNLKNLNDTIKKKYIPYQGFDIVSQPLRKRIIHILALKPYKKPEILARLMQEGISELDKNRLTITLYQVSSVKRELYYLDKWNEVEDDWRFYSPEDAATVQRRKQEQSQPNASLTPNNQPNNGLSKKRSLVDEIISNSSYPVQKKQKKTDTKETKNGVPSILQYVTNSSTKDNLHSASAVKNNTDQGTSLLSSIQRQSLLSKGFLSPASDIKILKTQVPLPSSSKKKRKKKKKNKKDIKRNINKKNEDKKKKNKKDIKRNSEKNEDKKKKKKKKKSKKKNRKKKDNFNCAGIGSIDSTKTVDSEVTFADTVHHKVFSHVQLGSQNSIHELNNKTEKEKHSIPAKRALNENFEASSHQLKKKKSDSVIFPAPVYNQRFDLSSIGSVSKKPQNESANKIEKTSCNAECSIKNVIKAHRPSHKRATYTENKVNEKISDRHNKGSVIFNFGLNNLVAKFSKSSGKEVNSERIFPNGNFKIADFPTQKSLYPNEKKEKIETNLSSSSELFPHSTKTSEVETCHSVDFTSPQQSNSEMDSLDALFFGDDPGPATAEDDILDDLFFGDDQVKENTNLPSTVEHNSLDTDIEIEQINKTNSLYPPQESGHLKKITSPPVVPSSTVEEHIEICTNTVSGQRSKTSSVIHSEDSSQMKKSPPGLPSSTVEEKTVKCTDTINGQLNKTSSVFIPEDFNKMKKPSSPSRVSSTVEEHIANSAVNGQMSKTSSIFLPEDSAQGNKITSPSAIPSSTVDDKSLHTNTVCLSNSSSALPFDDDSILVQEVNAPILKEKQNNSKVLGQSSHSESENFNSFYHNSEEMYKKRNSPSVLESVELFNKQRQFVPVGSLNNYESQVSRALESFSSQSISKILYGCPHENLVLSNTYGFKKKFCKISSFEQRTKYKEYFNSKYSSYLKLHKRITLAEARLTRLEENFKTLREGTPEYTVAMKELLEVYQMYFHDTQYNKFCQSRAYWHEELSYIRNLILEFDHEHLLNLVT